MSMLVLQNTEVFWTITMKTYESYLMKCITDFQKQKKDPGPTFTLLKDFKMDLPHKTATH